MAEKNKISSWRDDLTSNSPTVRRMAFYNVAKWVAETVVFFGGSPATAFRIAAIFVEGLEQDIQEDKGNKLWE